MAATQINFVISHVRLALVGLPRKKVWAENCGGVVFPLKSCFIMQVSVRSGVCYYRQYCTVGVWPHGPAKLSSVCSEEYKAKTKEKCFYVIRITYL